MGDMMGKAGKAWENTSNGQVGLQMLMWLHDDHVMATVVIMMKNDDGDDND